MLLFGTKEGRPSAFGRVRPALGTPVRELLISAREAVRRNADPSVAGVLGPPLGNQIRKGPFFGPQNGKGRCTSNNPSESESAPTQQGSFMQLLLSRPEKMQHENTRIS